MTDTIQVGSYTLKSRLLVGTGKYRDLDETGRAIEASGADVGTMHGENLVVRAAGHQLLQHLQLQVQPTQHVLPKKLETPSLVPPPSKPPIRKI